ncbi:MAG: UvrD-helicase domain-containing protein [Leptospirales bacterium]|nr:UvrD-helicase domain-containing protein [Leptospirales bacterium]
MDIISGLNKNQREAVLHTEGPLLILAGAGSGKTKVITHRIAHIINENKAEPWAIFAVTFTNKAANEMRERVIKLAGPAGNSVFVKTFHSAAVYILRRFGAAIGIPRNFSIYDTNDQAALVKTILEEMKIDTKKNKPSQIASVISGIKDKSDFIDGGDPFINISDFHYIFNLQEIFDTYHERMAKQNALDFNDLLIKCVELLRRSPDTLAALQRQWKYFMVDEYQDTNRVQYIMAKTLASATKNICVVGDDDQSIYSWRGADIRNILDFEKDYSNTSVITLEENYRSTSQILEAASCLIQNNVGRKEKKVIAVNGEGEPIIYNETGNNSLEAEFVANKILSLKTSEKFSYNSFAILYRTNLQSAAFETQLRYKGIPHKTVGGIRFYDRKEIKDITAYLRFVVNLKDDISLMRIINMPPRGIGKAAIEKIKKTADLKFAYNTWEAIDSGAVDGTGIASFKELINNLLLLLKNGEKLSEFVNQTIILSGYMEYVKNKKDAEVEEIIDRFIDESYDYERANPEASLLDFLQDTSLLTSADSPEANSSEKVTLMTVHNAKGLEFPVVFITGMEETIFPHRFSADSEESLEEERRLFYVAITRAMKRLFITNARMRRYFNERVEYNPPSRFIDEIPESLLESDNEARTRRYFSERPAYKRHMRFKYETPEDDDEDYPQAIEDNERVTPKGSAFKIKDRVHHNAYGYGTVINIEGSGDNIKLTILFSTERKVFIEKYTSLEKV